MLRCLEDTSVLGFLEGFQIVLSVKVPTELGVWPLHVPFHQTLPIQRWTLSSDLEWREEGRKSVSGFTKACQVCALSQRDIRAGSRSPGIHALEYLTLSGNP